MFISGQIVWDVTDRKPVIAYSRGSSYRATHFIKVGFREYEIAFPSSISEATQQLLDGTIQPAPLPPTHCHVCFHWKSVHKGGSCPYPELINARWGDLVSY